MKPMENLANLGKLDEEVTVLGFKFALRTLDSDEYISSKSAVALWDRETRDDALKIETLARAVESVDGVPFSALVKPEDKDRPGIVLTTARKNIATWQPAVIDRVYNAYRQLIIKQNKQLEEIEKNGNSLHTSTTAGE